MKYLRCNIISTQYKVLSEIVSIGSVMCRVSKITENVIDIFVTQACDDAALIIPMTARSDADYVMKQILWQEVIDLNLVAVRDCEVTTCLYMQAAKYNKENFIVTKQTGGFS